MTNENQNNPQPQGEETTQDTDKPLSIVDEAAKIRDEIKAENDRREQLLKEEQKLQAENMLGGTSGGHVPVETKKQTPKEYSDKVMAGEIDFN